MGPRPENLTRAPRKTEQPLVALGRPFNSALPPQALAAIQAGVLQTTYRNRVFWKSPFDVVLYLRLIERLRPSTVIEIGSKAGGSALWFADTLTTIGIDSHVISIDLQPPVDLIDSRITFLGGNAAALDRTLYPHTLAKLPRPWLVTEDSAHTFSVCLSVLSFFDKHLAKGDYIVIEDGIVSELPGRAYEAYDDGPNRAVAAFLQQRGADYVIDADLCDHFGYNVTYNPNGWLRRAS